MQPIVVRGHGVPIPLAEALGRVLVAEGGGGFLTHDDETGDRDFGDIVLVDVVFCDSLERWDEVIECARRGRIVVAMINDLDVQAYAQALSLGAAGVVHFDMPSVDIASVIAAASRGEVVIPAFAAHAMAAQSTGRPIAVDMTPGEIEILSALASGQRILDAARTLSMSERTLRRRAQSIYLKLGARNRAEAIRRACDARLL